ncbi:hypothetical protein GCM10010517_15820 [Streptosporangium fragile]|uniref:Uncharacterized protein n=1 Tax=Streptosporangium fragile TaxID=46186 RepID=A0ABN3VUW8_9ACTN
MTRSAEHRLDFAGDRFTKDMAPVVGAFAANIADPVAGGAALSVRRDGEETTRRRRGDGELLLDLDVPVASVRPKFAAHGEDRIPVTDVPAHRAAQRGLRRCRHGGRRPVPPVGRRRAARLRGADPAQPSLVRARRHPRRGRPDRR